QSAVRSYAAALPGANQEMRPRPEPDAPGAPVAAARGPEGEPPRTTGAPRHSHLRTPEAAVREDHRRPGGDLRGSWGLGPDRHGDPRGEPGRGDQGPSPVPTRRAQ